MKIWKKNVKNGWKFIVENFKKFKGKIDSKNYLMITLRRHAQLSSIFEVCLKKSFDWRKKKMY